MRGLTISYRQSHALPVSFLRRSFVVLIFFTLMSCKKDPPIVIEEIIEESYALKIPKGFPKPLIPADNALTEKRIELGKLLFFDKILSRDNTVSCGSCHEVEKHFTDNLAVSIGVEGRKGTRNAPSVVNSAYTPYLFWDGGNPTLEQQVVAPFDNPNELDVDINLIVERLKQHSTYPALFQEAYGQAPSVFSLTRAIACYERSLIQANSRYDDYLQNNNALALSASEKNGMVIFMGERGECFHCHGSYNFTDNSFQNNGLYSQYVDSGRQRITLKLEDHGKFKVPSLRNVAKTAPYMHDGSLATLEEVVEHYNKGGKAGLTKSFLIQPLGLNADEKKDLVNFLKALTDE